MYEQLKNHEGNKIVVELSSGRQLAGTVVEVDQQAVRLKTDEAACIIPLRAIQVFWESKKHDLIEESAYQAMPFEGRAPGGGGGGGGYGGGGGGGGGIHGGGGGYGGVGGGGIHGGGGSYGGGYPGPGYPGYPGIGPCSQAFSRNCYAYFNQNPCFQLFAAEPCATPYFMQCGQPFVQTCSTPFAMQCSTAFTS